MVPLKTTITLLILFCDKNFIKLLYSFYRVKLFCSTIFLKKLEIIFKDQNYF